MFNENLQNKICVFDGRVNVAVQGSSEEVGITVWDRHNYDFGVYTGYIDDDGYYIVRPFGSSGTVAVFGAIKVKEPGSFSRNTAQDELNKLLRDHKYIMQNLEASAMFAQDNAALGNTQYKGGLTVKQTIAGLYSNLRERESQLIDDDLVESTATGYNGGAYTAGQEALANVIRNTRISGVGAIPAVAIYVIAAVVSVAVGVFIYYKIKNMREAADYDLNLSNEFLSWLKKQSPETTKIVLDQLKATGDSAYKAALDEKGTGLLNWIKNAGNGVKFALMAAGAFVVWTQVDKMQANKAKRKFKSGR